MLLSYGWLRGIVFSMVIVSSNGGTRVMCYAFSAELVWKDGIISFFNACGFSSVSGRLACFSAVFILLLTLDMR